MQNIAFSKIARGYDVYSGASYDAYRDFIVKAIDGFSKIKVEDIIDLGCGTAVLTHELAKRGYGMIGVDNSEEMLSAAREKYDDILFLHQDMRSFELYGTVQAAVCTYDGLNYLTGAADLKKVFLLLRNYLEPGGLFIFDINTLYKYENVLSSNAFVYENANDMLVWQNYFDKNKKKCDFYLSLFEEGNDGRYIRSDEFQRQTYFSERTIKRVASECGFIIRKVCGDLDGGALGERSEKAYYIMERGE